MIRIIVSVMLCVTLQVVSAKETIKLGTVDVQPDPLTAPVTLLEISAGFSVSGTAKSVDSKSAEKKHLLRTTVIIRGPAPSTATVATLTNDVPASREKGMPKVLELKADLNWDRTGFPAGIYQYEVQGEVVLYQRKKKGKNTTPKETVRSTSTSTTGEFTVVGESNPGAPGTPSNPNAPGLANITPPPSSATNNPRPEIGAIFTTVKSSVNFSTLQVSLDGTPLSVTLTASGFTYTSPTDLSHGVHTVKVVVATLAGDSATHEWTFTVDLKAPVVVKAAPSGVTVNSDSVISAKFSDPDSGVDPASLELYVDGILVPATDVTANDFVVAKTLTNGTHTASFTIKDKAGNSTLHNYTFVVDTISPHIFIQPNFGSLPLTWNAVVLQSGDDVTANYGIQWSNGPSGAFSGNQYVIPLGSVNGDYTITATATSLSGVAARADDGLTDKRELKVDGDKGSEPASDNEPSGVVIGLGKDGDRTIDGDRKVGLEVQMKATSPKAKLPNYTLKEIVRVDPGSLTGSYKQSPPGGLIAQKGFLPIAAPLGDLHAVSVTRTREMLNAFVSSDKINGSFEVKQLFVYKRPGEDSENVIPNSGFRITHELSKISDTSVRVTIFKEPAEIDLGFKSAPGTGREVNELNFELKDGVWEPKF